MLTSGTVSYTCASGSLCLRYTLIFFSLRRRPETVDICSAVNYTNRRVEGSSLTVWGAIVLNRKFVVARGYYGNVKENNFISLVTKVSGLPWSFITKVVVMKRWKEALGFFEVLTLLCRYREKTPVLAS